MSFAKVFGAMVAAAGLPDLDDADEWNRVGEMWRSRNDDEDVVDRAKRIEELEEQVEDLEGEVDEARREASEDEQKCSQLADELTTMTRERAALARANASLNAAFEKISLTVPAVAVREVLVEIVAACDAKLPGHSTRIVKDASGEAEQVWHPLLRMIRNAAGRGLKSIDEVRK